MTTQPEYMPWYKPDTTLIRCGGDAGCGSLLISGDIEVHTRWHERLASFAETAQTP